MSLALLFAFLSPVFYAATNVLDKHIISNRVKDPLSYAPLIGIVNMAFTLIIALFLDWSLFPLGGVAIAVVIGIMEGFETYLYVLVLRKEDVSYTTGFVYLYPVLVALLSFLFLGEVIPIVGYLGMALVMSGIVLLIIRRKALARGVALWMLPVFVVTIALREFAVKVSTITLPALNGMVISTAMFSLVLIGGLLVPRIRAGFPLESRNIRWTFVSEVFTIGAFVSMFLAMAGLPATVATSIFAIQPIVALVFERIADRHLGAIMKDHLLLPKLGAIALIIAGIILLSLTSA